MTAGCTYRGSTSLSVHGKVTDFQMWRRVLAEEELEQITGCQAFPVGDLVSWEGDSWFLNSSRGTVSGGGSTDRPGRRPQTWSLRCALIPAPAFTWCLCLPR